MEKNTDSVGLSRCSLGYITGLSDAPAGPQPRRAAQEGEAGWAPGSPSSAGLRPDRREWACVDEPVVALGFP